MTVLSAHLRIGRTVAVVVAASAFGVASSLALAVADRPQQLAPQHQAAQRAALAEWTTTNHLAGLSPASLAPLDRDHDIAAYHAAELAAIAEFAVAEGLSGLSPASLRPVGD